MKLRGRVGLAVVLGAAATLGAAVVFLAPDVVPTFLAPDGLTPAAAGEARSGSGSGPATQARAAHGPPSSASEAQPARVSAHAEAPARATERAAAPAPTDGLPPAPLPRGPHDEIPYEHADPLMQATTDVAALEVEAAFAAADGRTEDAERARAERDRAIGERDSLARQMSSDAGRGR